MAKQTFTTGQVLTAQEMTDLQKNDYNQTVSAKVASYTLVASDAGTRITMANASATTITVDTNLFTAGDTLTITNISSGVCTITAGTATVSTGGSLALNQYDSGTLYFTSTGVSIWNGPNPGDITGVTAGTGISGGGTSGTVTVTNSMATAITTNGDVLYGTGSGTFNRLGIGSSAQVLTVASGIPSWATPAAAGSGLTLIKRASFSAVTTTTTTFDSLCTTSYKAYLMVIESIKSSTSADMYVQFRKGAVTQTASYYGASYGTMYNGTAYSYLTNGLAQSTMFQAGSTGNESGASITFYQMGSGSNQLVMGAGTFFENNSSRGGTITISNAGNFLFDGWMFSASTGTITGTVAIYGLEI